MKDLRPAPFGGTRAVPGIDQTGNNAGRPGCPLMAKDLPACCVWVRPRITFTPNAGQRPLIIRFPKIANIPANGTLSLSRTSTRAIKFTFGASAVPNQSGGQDALFQTELNELIGPALSRYRVLNSDLPPGKKTPHYWRPA